MIYLKTKVCVQQAPPLTKVYVQAKTKVCTTNTHFPHFHIVLQQNTHCSKKLQHNTYFKK